MIQALLQHIPRCLFEPVAVLGLLGFILFLALHWKQDKCETALFALALLFMIAWRVLMPVNADRYALILIPGAVYFSLYAVEKLATYCRRFCRFPHASWFFCILLAVFLMQSFHRYAEDRQMFDLIRILKDDAGNGPAVCQVVSNRDVTCFLGSRFKVVLIPVQQPLELPALPTADYCLLRMNRKQWELEGPEIKEKAAAFWEALKQNGKFAYVLWKEKKVDE